MSGQCCNAALNDRQSWGEITEKQQSVRLYLPHGGSRAKSTLLLDVSPPWEILAGGKRYGPCIFSVYIRQAMIVQNIQSKFEYRIALNSIETRPNFCGSALVIGRHSINRSLISAFKFGPEKSLLKRWRNQGRFVLALPVLGVDNQSYIDKLCHNLQMSRTGVVLY